MQARKALSFPGIMYGIVVMLVLLFSAGFFQDAYAASPCKDSKGADVQGFTVAIIYCVRASLTDALTGSHVSNIANVNPGYLTQVANFLSPFKWAAITLAIALFGVKLMTVSVDEVLKEGAGLLFRIALVLYLVDSLASPGFYSSGTGPGLYAAAADAAGELVSFVATGFTQVTTSCTPPPLPAGVNAAEYTVWQAFDCMFAGLMGASTNPAVIGTGIVVVLGAAMLSGSLGIYIILMAITLFIMALLSLMRAIYILILSYFVLALLMVIGPLIIPIRVFDNKFTAEIFWKWVGLISSTIIQPMFIIGFLSFVIMAEDQFVNGNLSGCNIGAAGACSFKQLIAKCAPLNFPDSTCITNTPLIQIHLNVKFPTQNCTGNWLQQMGCNIGNAVTDVVNWAADQLNNMLSFIGNIGIKVPMLNANFPLKQLFVSICAFLIITVVFRSLMDVVPNMAKQITGAAGVGLMQLAQLPLEGVIANAVKSGGDAMKTAGADAKAAGKSGIGSMPGAIGSGAKGVGQSILRSIIK